MHNEGGVSILLYLGEERDPFWMSYKCHTSKKNRQVKEESLLGFW
jgi:hypothetical protein